MGAFSLHVFAQAFGRASVECMERKCALFSCADIVFIDFYLSEGKDRRTR